MRKIPGTGRSQSKSSRGGTCRQCYVPPNALRWSSAQAFKSIAFTIQRNNENMYLDPGNSEYRMKDSGYAPLMHIKIIGRLRKDTEASKFDGHL